MIKSRLDPTAYKGKIEYVFNGSHSDQTATEVGFDVLLRLYIPRALGTVDVSLFLLNKNMDFVSEEPGEWSEMSFDFDVYDVNFGTQLQKGLYFIKGKINTPYGYLYISSFGKTVFFSDKDEGIKPQLTVSDFKYAPPKDYYGGIIYHIFVDRFNKGGKSVPHKGDIIVDDWTGGVPEYPDYKGAPLKNNTFYGGTLYGIAEKIDYIASLGVSTIYLSPIFTSPSNHKYDTADYMSVDSIFGSDEALEYLISKAKEKGIAIILDGVFNHTGADSIYFNRYGTYKSLGAYQSKDSQYYSWYEFKKYPDEYTCWWGIEILPRINPDKPECQEFFVGKGGVIEKYAKMGIGGFRLDVCDELSDGFIHQIKDKLNEYNKGSILYGEVWEDASNKVAYDRRKEYYLGQELDGVMNYPLREGIIDYILNKNTRFLEYALRVVLSNSPQRILNAQMNIIGTHDTERILTVLSGVSGENEPNSVLCTKRLSESERSLARKRLVAAYTILVTLPGIPSIFYGDEAGVEGYNDPFNRLPYPWGEEDDYILTHFRKIGKIRRENYVYKKGRLNLIHIDGDLLVFSRLGKNYEYITVYNNSSFGMKLYSDKSFYDLLKGKKRAIKETILDPESSTIIKVNKETPIYIKSSLYYEAEL